jgi:hypothetical protein
MQEQLLLLLSGACVLGPADVIGSRYGADCCNGILSHQPMRAMWAQVKSDARLSLLLSGIGSTAATNSACWQRQRQGTHFESAAMQGAN